MDNIKLLDLVRSHRVYLLIVMISGSLAGLFYFNLNYNFYKASTTIYVSGEPVVNKSDVDDEFYVEISRIEESWAIQQMLLSSNEMTDTLNRTFKLYDHYGIDSTSAYSFDKLSNIISQNLSIEKKNKLDLFELSFQDKDAAFAIRFVNILASKLDDLNRELLLDKLNKQASIYKLVLSDLDSDEAKLSSQLTQKLISINELLKNISNDKSQSDFITNLQQNILNLSTDLRIISQKMANAGNAYQIAQKSISENTYPIIKVIEKAVPRNNSNFIQFIFFGALGMLLLTGLYLAFLFLFASYRKEISFLLGK